MKQTGWLVAVALLLGGMTSVSGEGVPLAEVQRHLKEKRLYGGAIHGRDDLSTRAALRRYQILHGLRASGEADPQTLETMALEAVGREVLEEDRRFLEEAPPPPSTVASRP